MNVKKFITSFVSVLVIILICVLIKNNETYASINTDPYTFYQTYNSDGSKPVLFLADDSNNLDGAFYFATRGKIASSTSNTRFAVLGYRATIKIDGVTSEVYLNYDNNEDNKNYSGTIEYKERNVGDYCYNLKIIRYSELMKRFQLKYPTRNFQVLRTGGDFRIEFNGLLTTKTRSSSTSTTWTVHSSVKENSDGTWTITGANRLGTTLTTMQNSYGSTWSNYDFGSFYGITGRVSVAIKSLDVSQIALTASSGISDDSRYTNGYYVKQGSKVTLKFSSTSTFSTSTYQPNANFFNIARKTDVLQTVDIRSPNGSSVTSEYYWTSNTDFVVTSISQSRNSAQTKLSSTMVGYLDEDEKIVRIHPQSKIYLGGSLTSSNGKKSSTYVTQETSQLDNSVSVVLTCDGKAPTITGSNSSAWTNQSVTLSYSATDSGSGMKALELLLNGSTLISKGTSSANHTFTTTGSYPMTIRATDNVGNVGTKAYTINIDKTSPTINGSNSSAWTKDNVTLSYSGVDNHSGMKSIQILNGSTVLASGTASVTHTLSTNGVYNLTIKATDNANNVTTKTIPINLDKIAPTISGSNSSAWTNQNVTLSYSATDSGSGMKSIQIIKGSTVLASGVSSATYTLTTNGVNNITIKATDNVGNISTKVVTVNIDKVAPIISGSNSSAWTNQNVSLSYSATDSGSGMKSVQILNGTTVIASGLSSATYTLSASGVYNITVKATDNANNISTKTVTIKIDKVAPSIIDISNLNYNTVFTTPIKLDYKGSDSESGMKSIQIFNGSTLLSESIDILSYRHKMNGTNTLTIKLTDNANNVTTRNITINMDIYIPCELDYVNYDYDSQQGTFTYQANYIGNKANPTDDIEYVTFYMYDVDTGGLLAQNRISNHVSGTWKGTSYFKDMLNVINTTTNVNVVLVARVKSALGSFDVEVDNVVIDTLIVKAKLYRGSNEYKRFMVGETPILKIRASSYVETLQIVFPVEFTTLDSTLNRTLIVGTLTDFNTRFCYSDKDYYFNVPNVPEGEYEITVIAKRNGKSKSTKVNIEVIKNLFDDVRTRIRLK